MCGRYTDTKRDKEFLVRMGITAAEFDFTPRYNIAPTQDAWIAARADGPPVLQRARWGLIPFWARDEKIGNSLINARSDGVASKPAFRHAFKKQRCLVLADGFYEWKKLPKGKQPVYFRMREQTPFVFGGLWETWQKEGQEVRSFCIITVEPNKLAATVHDRMPLILGEADLASWLDPATPLENLKDLLKPCPHERMECFPVNPMVNSARNESSRCIEPVSLEEPSSDVSFGQLHFNSWSE